MDVVFYSKQYIILERLIMYVDVNFLFISLRLVDFFAKKYTCLDTNGTCEVLVNVSARGSIKYRSKEHLIEFESNVDFKSKIASFFLRRFRIVRLFICRFYYKSL